MNNIIPAVDKTVQLLLRLADKEASQAELSRNLGITMSTAYRILVTLQAHNWVRKNEAGVYSLSGGVLPLTLGLSRDMAMLEKACTQVRRISETHGIACKISIRRGEEQLTFFRAEPPGPVALTGLAGSTFPLIEGSVGAALLSGEPEETLTRLIAECPAAISEREHPELLLEGVREVKKRGSVLNPGKNRWNITALSMPLPDARGRVAAALTLIGASEDFAGRKRAEWEKILQRAVKECQN